LRGCEKEDGEGWRKERNVEQSKAKQRMKGIKGTSRQSPASTVCTPTPAYVYVYVYVW
jgi:hypothetical protein